MASCGTFELAIRGAGAANQFVASGAAGGGQPAEQAFEFRADSMALATDLGELARAAVAGEPPKDDIHRKLGASLYAAAFGGAVGELWGGRRQEANAARQALRLLLRIDTETARPLLDLPWEYLHDGSDFLCLNWRTPLSRLPSGVAPQSLPALTEALRLLVVISAPLDLNENEVLNTAHEEDLILIATAAARRAGRMQVEFSPKGSPEALEEALREFDPHLLHFTGHGVFDRERDQGFLLMETGDGRRREVPNWDFCQCLERGGESLRFVFLSACQSAKVSSTGGYSDLASRLLAAGFPAVVAMKHSVLNRSAMDFASALYEGLAKGEAVDAATIVARGRLAREGLNRMDFGVPALYLSDPACLQVEVAAAPARAARPQDLSGVALAQNFRGRTAELRELRARLDPENGSWRAAIVHGLGGIGKTVLAGRLAERMMSRFDGIFAMRMTPVTTARDVLDRVAGFLQIHRDAFGAPKIGAFVNAKDQPVPLEAKAGALAEVLRRLRLLIILDNYEDVVPEGRTVSRGAKEETTEADPELDRLISSLLENVDGPSRFLFTSRVDFSPIEAGRLTDAIGHLPLSEMRFRDAVYLMETLPPLDALPVAPVPAARFGVEEEAPAKAQPVTLRDIHARLGGHPYTLNLFAEHARRSSPGEVLADLSGVAKEAMEFTLLDRAAARLTDRAALLLRRAAIYEEPVPAEGLAYMLGDERDVMPEVDGEVQSLLSWGLLSQPPGSDAYALHSLVREWARAQMDAEERRELLLRAARYWEAAGEDSRDIADHLNARHYFFEAGEHEHAYDLVEPIFGYLLRWGHIELSLRLLNESIRTLDGDAKMGALGNRANVYQGVGHYEAARRDHETALAHFRQIGRRDLVAVALHQLGMLHQDQGEYPQARQRYEESLAIRGELGDRAGIAGALHQLGVLCYLQGEYPQARQRYEESLAIKRELGDRARIATSLHQLGMLHENQGEYPQARQRYEESLAIKQELGDRVGIARSLHQLGNLHYRHGEYAQARQRCEESLAIKRELGDRAGIASSLHQLGVLHCRQGEYAQARQRYEESLAIKREVGDRAGTATSLHAVGNLHYLQGEYAQARQRYEESLAVVRELGDRAGIAASLHQLGMLHQAQGEYPQARQRYEESLAIKQDLGDRAGIASSLGQLGVLAEEMGEHAQAVGLAAQAFAIFRELRSPDRDVATGHLARLRETMGDEAFREALRQAGFEVGE